MTDLATKKLWLAEAELAMHRLQTGTAEVTVNFGTSKGATFNQANVRDLWSYIERLKAEIATMEGAGAPRRGPVRFLF